MRRYAENTTVPVEKSRAEIETLLKKHGATAFFSAFDETARTAMIGFRLKDRMFRIEVRAPAHHEAPRRPPPEKPEAYRRAYRGQSPETLNERLAKEHQAAVERHAKGEAGRAAEWVEAELRRRWRAQLLLIKAKLETIAMGASSVEREFLADMLMPDGKTVGQRAIPALAESYASGKALSLPFLLGSGDD